MNLGLGHLTELKRHLLNAALRPSTEYDVALAALGRGVAARFESFCDRKFGRDAAATYECEAIKRGFVLDRYPLEALTKLELRDTLGGDYVDQGEVDALVENLSEKSGIVWLYAPLAAARRSRLRATFAGGYWFPTAPAIVIQRGQVTFEEDQATATVEFDPPFDAIPTIKLNLTGGDGSTVVTPGAYDVTKEGFTIRLAAAAGADPLSVNWMAMLGNEETDTSILQSGNAALAVNDESKEIEFAEEFSAEPLVFCNILAPDGGLIISAEPMNATTAGFIAPIAFPIPALGYKLSWFALDATAAAAAQTLPDGATALPTDLKFAWLTQCKHVAAKTDLLGLAPFAASEKAPIDAAAIELLPGVTETLKAYRRFAL